MLNISDCSQSYELLVKWRPDLQFIENVSMDKQVYNKRINCFDFF